MAYLRQSYLESTILNAILGDCNSLLNQGLFILKVLCVKAFFEDFMILTFASWP